MDYHDTSNLQNYIRESYRNIKDKNEARSYNEGYLQATYDFQIIQWPHQKNLREYNEKLFKLEEIK